MVAFIISCIFAKISRNVDLDKFLGRYHNRSAMQINKKVKLRAQNSRKYLLKIATNLKSARRTAAADG